MKSDIGGTDVSRDDVLAATDYVAPSLEILDTRILRSDPATGQTRKVFDTITDNAANAGVVLGKERQTPDNLRWVGAIVSVNGTVEETGLGAGVLNDPVESVVWPARHMAVHGNSIRAGQVILSGSFIRPIECPPAPAFRPISVPSGRYRWILPDPDQTTPTARNRAQPCKADASSFSR